MTAPDQVEQRRADVREARALAHPLRVRILRLCLDRAMTNAELAGVLGEIPATVRHHVRTLVASGFLAEERWRRGPRGSTEKPYRATGKSWQLHGALGAGDGAVTRAVFQAVAAEIEEAGPDAILEGARMSLRLDQPGLDRLLGQIRELIASVPSALEHLSDTPPPGDPYAMLVVLHRRHVPPGPGDRR